MSLNIFFKKNRILVKSVFAVFLFLMLDMPTLLSASYVLRANAPKLLRGNIEALTGSALFAVQGSLMAPLWARPDRVLYMDLQGDYDTHSKGNSLELGLGYRQIKDIQLGKYFNQEMIIGGYFFLDRTTSKGATKDRSYYQGNIGGSLYNKELSLSVNGYFAIGRSKWDDGDAWATQLGDYSQEEYDQHTMYDAKYKLSDITSDWGLDVQAGHVIPIPRVKGLKGYLGGYYYHTKDAYNLKSSKKLGSKIGLGLRATYQLNKYFMLDLRDTYDNYEHNTVMLGVRFSAGGTINDGMDPNALTSNLLDPVEHNMGELSSVGSVQSIRDTKTQIIKGSQTGNHLFEQVNHVYFFDQAGSINADGTYENPYSLSQLNDETLSNIKEVDPDYSHIYVAGGTDTNVGNLTLYGEQSLEGRYGSDNGFEKAASFDEVDQMPVLNGSLVLDGGDVADPQVITGIKFFNTGSAAAMTVGNESNENAIPSNIDINGVQIGYDGNATDDRNYSSGIDVISGEISNVSGDRIFADDNGILVHKGAGISTVAVSKGSFISGLSYAIDNSGDIGDVMDEGIVSGGTATLKNAGKIEGGIFVDKGAVFSSNGGVSIDNEDSGTINEVENLGTMSSIVNYGEMGAITNQGSITGNQYGIDNEGTIVGKIDLEAGSTLVGNKASVYDSAYGKIEGGITNASTISVLDLGTIGSATSNYGIYNTSKGVITSISGESNVQSPSSGVITGEKSGIYNQGVIDLVSNLKKISGTGANSSGVYNTNEIGSIVISATQGADASSISGKSNSVDNEAAASIGELENGGNLGVVLDNGIIGEDFTTSDKGTYSNYGIENEKGGVISSIEGSGKIVGNSVAVDNKGLIVDVSGTAKIEGLGSASYGIVNDGEIDGIQLSSSGQISGVVASIRNNENATIGTSLSGSIGITNDGNMGEIDNYGTIEGSTYGIDNKGVLAGITGGESLSGTIKGGEAGIYNEKGGTLKEITNEKTIEGTGDGSYGIDNAGEMTSNLVIVSGEDISGTSYSIENSGDIFEIDNEGTLSSLENSGTIGNAENESSSYGIENAGTINEITNEAKGTIEGSVDSINNETGAQIGMSGTTGISNAGHIQTIENQGTIGVSGSVGIENTGEITTVNNIIGGEIEGEIENEVSSTNAATGSTGINLISNAGTISADLTNGGNIVSLENKANGNIQGTILNTGTISGIENYSIINTLTNEGTLGSATQGIDNGANATINDLTNEGGGLITLITNESSGTIDNLTNTESSFIIGNNLLKFLLNSLFLIYLPLIL